MTLYLNGDNMQFYIRSDNHDEVYSIIISIKRSSYGSSTEGGGNLSQLDVYTPLLCAKFQGNRVWHSGFTAGYYYIIFTVQQSKDYNAQV